jgi:hypothetical protein
LTGRRSLTNHQIDKRENRAKRNFNHGKTGYFINAARLSFATGATALVLLSCQPGKKESRNNADLAELAA